MDFAKLFSLNSFKKNDKKIPEHLQQLKTRIFLFVCRSKVKPDSSGSSQI